MPRRDDDYDDEDDTLRRSRRRRDEDDDFDDDYRPRSKRRDRDGGPTSSGKPGLATTAGVFWAIWCVFCLLGALGTVVFVVRAEMDDRVNMPQIYTPTSVCSAFLSLLVAGLCGFAAFRTLSGQAKSLTLYAVLSMVFPFVVILSRTLMGFLVGVEMVKDMRGANGVPLSMAGSAFVFSALLMSGVMLAGLFAFLSNGKYREWRGTGDRDR